MKNNSILQSLFLQWSDVLGDNTIAYQNHVFRILEFFEHLKGSPAPEPVIVAAFFHDLGIWEKQTFDYLAPSVQLAEEYLLSSNHPEWIPLVRSMILEHHKIFPYREIVDVELFRKADLIDLSLGMVRCGLEKSKIREIQKGYPNAGFHRFLLAMTWKQFKKHPIRPFPMFHW